MDFNIIFNKLQNLGLKDLRIAIRENDIFIEAMDYEHRPHFEVDFQIVNNQKIIIQDINFRFGYFDSDTNKYDDSYYLDKEITMDFNKFILFMDKLIEKYSEKIKKKL